MAVLVSPSAASSSQQQVEPSPPAFPLLTNSTSTSSSHDINSNPKNNNSIKSNASLDHKTKATPPGTSTQDSVVAKQSSSAGGTEATQGQEGSLGDGELTDMKVGNKTVLEKSSKSKPEFERNPAKVMSTPLIHSPRLLKRVDNENDLHNSDDQDTNSSDNLDDDAGDDDDEDEDDDDDDARDTKTLENISKGEEISQVDNNLDLVDGHLQYEELPVPMAQSGKRKLTLCFCWREMFHTGSYAA